MRTGFGKCAWESAISGKYLEFNHILEEINKLVFNQKVQLFSNELKLASR